MFALHFSTIFPKPCEIAQFPSKPKIILRWSIYLLIHCVIDHLEESGQWLYKIILRWSIYLLIHCVIDYLEESGQWLYKVTIQVHLSSGPHR